MRLDGFLVNFSLMVSGARIMIASAQAATLVTYHRHAVVLYTLTRTLVQEDRLHGNPAVTQVQRVCPACDP